MNAKQKCIRELEKLNRKPLNEKRIESTLAKIRPRIVADEKLRPLLRDFEERVRDEDLKGAIKILRGPYYVPKMVLFYGAVTVLPVVAALLLLSTVVKKCDPLAEQDKVVVAFTGDLAAGRLKQAYERMTPDYRKRVGFDAFARQVQSTPLLATLKKFKPRGGAKSGNETEIYGTWTTKTGQHKAVVTVHEPDGKYYVHAVEIDKKSLLPQPNEPGSAVPDKQPTR